MGETGDLFEAVRVRDDEKRAELAELAAQVEHHERAYRAGTPEISDGAFDDLFERYQQLADELGISTLELGRVGQQGKITGDVIYAALTKRLETLRDEADSMPATI